MIVVLDRRHGALAFGLGSWKTILRVELKQAGLKSKGLLDPWWPGASLAFVCDRMPGGRARMVKGRPGNQRLRPCRGVGMDNEIDQVT